MNDPYGEKSYQVVAVLAPSDDLRRHVLDRAAERVGALDGVVCREGPAQAEVGQDDVTFLVEQNVLELDVAVDHSVLVSKSTMKRANLILLDFKVHQTWASLMLFCFKSSPPILNLTTQSLEHFCQITSSFDKKIGCFVKQSFNWIL